MNTCVACGDELTDEDDDTLCWSCQEDVMDAENIDILRSIDAMHHAESANAPQPATEIQSFDFPPF